MTKPKARPRARPPSLEARARAALDAWFGTLARYVGLVVLLYVVFIDQGRNPALLPLIPGLLLLKNVARGGKDDGP